MRIAASAAMVLAVSAGAFAEQEDALATLVTSMPITGEAGGGEGPRAPGAGAQYSDITNFTGFAAAAGGTAAVSGIQTTRMLADDISMVAPVSNVTLFTFSVANFNASAVSARPRVRFFAADGAGGAPGTLLFAITFTAISFPASSVNLFNFNPSPLALPQNFWAGMFFDNSGTTATATQLNNLGQGLYDPVDVGSSQDRDFLTTAAGIPGSNPVGAIRPSPFGANPKANYGWEVIPTPGSASLFGVVGFAMLRRRRA